MIDVSTAFFIVGAIIIIGYFCQKIFDKVKIPDVIILMGLGLIMGPVLNIFGDGTLGAFRQIMPYFAAVALIIILFEVGMNLNFFKVLKTLNIATAFTVAVSGLCLISITIILVLLMKWPLLESILLAAIISGSDSAVIIPLINRTKASEDTKMLIDLETTINDLLIVVVFAAAGAIKAQELSIPDMGQKILASFSIAAIAGFVVALAWLKLQRPVEKRKYEYLLTLAVLFLLYATVEYFKANGAIAALVFGIVLGNAKEITGMLKLAPKDMDYKVMMFQEEISFFVRTFFFVYLGMMFESNALNTTTGIISVIILIGIVVSRYVTATGVGLFSKNLKKDRPYIVSSMSRGIAAAVLASVPLSLGLGEIGRQSLLITFLVILLSNIVTTAGFFISERKDSKVKKGKTTEEELKENHIEQMKV